MKLLSITVRQAWKLIAGFASCTTHSYIQPTDCNFQTSMEQVPPSPELQMDYKGGTV